MFRTSSGWNGYCLCMWLADAKKKPADDIMFDDDDSLDLGLDSPRPTTRKPSLLPSDSDSNRPARSVLDDMLGTKTDKNASKEKRSTADQVEDFMSSLKSSSKLNSSTNQNLFCKREKRNSMFFCDLVGIDTKRFGDL
jgi:hypothetical protein